MILDLEIESPEPEEQYTFGSLGRKDMRSAIVREDRAAHAASAATQIRLEFRLKETEEQLKKYKEQVHDSTSVSSISSRKLLCYIHNNTLCTALSTKLYIVVYN